jgi:hypothetical protein
MRYPKLELVQEHFFAYETGSISKLTKKPGVSDRNGHYEPDDNYDTILQSSKSKFFEILTIVVEQTCTGHFQMHLNYESTISGS